MARTVDLVVTGDDTAAAAAIDAVQRGRRVLLVLRSGGARAVQRVRRRVRQIAKADDSQLTVMSNAEVVCVDGVDRVEAVVIRHARTGRLCAVNAAAFWSCDGLDGRCVSSAPLPMKKRAGSRVTRRVRAERSSNAVRR